jgi:hypothetical protein
MKFGLKINNMASENLPHDSLGSNPEENLRIENELLKLKMQAELGASLRETGSDLSPEIENMFLKNIMAFHQQSSDNKLITVFAKLKNPLFKPAEDLDDTNLSIELIKIENLLLSENIYLRFADHYPDRTKYTFITKELFDVEMQDKELPDMVHHFDYEEFHPNHKNDITSKAESFIIAFFDKNIVEDNWDLADYFILPEGKMVNKKTVVNQIQNIFFLSENFIKGEYSIIDASFDLMADGNGMGYVEGFVSYEAVLAIGENELIHGPFKLYFSFEHGWWQIVYIVFPGFEF